MNPAERLQEKVYHEPNTGCWIYGGRWDKDGYGMFHFQGRTIRAHQAAWAIFHGKLPRGREIDHTCTCRACCNPDHLQAVSQACNCRRIWSRRKAAA